MKKFLAMFLSLIIIIAFCAPGTIAMADGPISIQDTSQVSNSREIDEDYNGGPDARFYNGEIHVPVTEFTNIETGEVLVEGVDFTRTYTYSKQPTNDPAETTPDVNWEEPGVIKETCEGINGYTGYWQWNHNIYRDGIIQADDVTITVGEEIPAELLARLVYDGGPGEDSLAPTWTVSTDATDSSAPGEFRIIPSHVFNVESPSYFKSKYMEGDGEWFQYLRKTYRRGVLNQDTGEWEYSDPVDVVGGESLVYRVGEINRFLYKPGKLSIIAKQTPVDPPGVPANTDIVPTAQIILFVGLIALSTLGSAVIFFRGIKVHSEE